MSTSNEGLQKKLVHPLAVGEFAIKRWWELYHIGDAEKFYSFISITNCETMVVLQFLGRHYTPCQPHNPLVVYEEEEVFILVFFLCVFYHPRTFPFLKIRFKYPHDHSLERHKVHWQLALDQIGMYLPLGKCLGYFLIPTTQQSAVKTVRVYGHLVNLFSFLPTHLLQFTYHTT